MSISTTSNIQGTEAGFIETITVGCIWYINTYDDCQEFWKDAVLIIQEILGVYPLSSKTVNQYNA